MVFDTSIIAKVTEAEKKLILKGAELDKLSISAYTRRTLLLRAEQLIEQDSKLEVLNA